MHTLRIAIIVILMAGWTGLARAAEIRLLAEAKPAGPVVRLGDIAEIYAADPERAAVLRSVELFAAGGARSRTMQAHEVQELLFLRGFSPTECRMSGASQVTLLAAPAPVEPKAVMPAMEKRASNAVRGAIQQYAAHQRHADDVLDLQFTLSDEQVRAIDAAVYRVAVRGGSDPWIGPQHYDIVLASGGKPLPLDATVLLPPLAVVAKRALERGQVLQADDVTLARLKVGADTSGLFDRIESVVGSELTRALGPGQTIEDESLRQPLLVRKGDAVTVYTRSPGLQVRTTARAKEDGSLGELISIESMLNRQTFLARVSGSQEVEIYARPADTGVRRRPAAAAGMVKGG